ncbi:MAG: UbiH/UbiF family hydroxylase [Alphaproteobacteria bacterium]|nr:UbiH/UbiF family hydroxylase [Alphaproteobacteria bacterium]
MTTTSICDIFISGGGIAGLTAAAVFGTAGFDVICVDPTPPITESDTIGADMRTTALLQPARAMLMAAGIWEPLEPFSAALETMRIVDAGRPNGRLRDMKEFRASDLSESPFGWNFPNWRLKRELVNRLQTLRNVNFRTGVGAQSLFTRTAEARIGLTDGSTTLTKLVIAADGRASPLREAAGIPVHTTRYGQKALAFVVTHPVPHENVSTEIHKTGGPFTLVPLPNYDGTPSSAVVWMDDGSASLSRYKMPVDKFEAEITARSCQLYGPLTLKSKRSIWPIISQRAERLNGVRLALLAEAAHVVPPIGAQGLNMSLSDTQELLNLAKLRPEGLGDATMLDQYHKTRSKDIRLRLAGIDILNRTSQLKSAFLRDARSFGLKTLHEIRPVRHKLMRLGLGV